MKKAGTRPQNGGREGGAARRQGSLPGIISGEKTDARRISVGSGLNRQKEKTNPKRNPRITSAYANEREGRVRSSKNK